MEKRIFLGVCLLSVLGAVWCMDPINRLSRLEETIDPESVRMITDRASISKNGIPDSARRPATRVAVPRARIRQLIVQVNESITTSDEEDKKAFPTKRNSRTFPFGPHLLSSETARGIGRSGRLFVETAQRINTEFSGLLDLDPTEKAELLCPFSETQCDARSPYRTITGVCNNLRKPLWGSSNTPFERTVTPAYDDDISTPRSRGVRGRQLPLARAISTAIHEASGVRTLDSRFTHITMEFGQFVSHDIERFAAIEAPGGSELECCTDPSRPSTRNGCLAIEIPRNDPFFSKYSRRCMEFARALSTPNLQCDIGTREQLNQESAYLDGSAVYGSTTELNEKLRTGSGGLLKTTRGPDGELLLQDPDLKRPECRSQARRSCFKAGDARVNQQPALMSMHTIWLREHNRVVRELAKINPKWDDEKLFQEGRRIVGAEFQDVVYDEFLPVVVGPYVAKAFDFPAKKNGYNSDYDPSINAQIRSSFSSAGYRFGHTLVQTFFATDLKFRDHFLRPDVLYNGNQGTSFVIKNLFTKNQQKFDRLISPQLTNTLFEQTPGTGIDLAATNIQRGRDFGTPSYNVFRSLCGLPKATHFRASRGGLVNHSPSAAKLLEKTYSDVEDIDLWTGAISEKVLRGAVVGPTIACIVGRQFFLLKKGDRFFYENDDKNAKFSLGQLDQIRKTSFARIICDTTDTKTAQRNVFRYPHRSRNPTLDCDRIPSVDLTLWAESDCVNGGWGKWSPYSRCFLGFSFQYRRCDKPRRSFCGKPCAGLPIRWKRCGRTRSGQDPLEVARRFAPKDLETF